MSNPSEPDAVRTHSTIQEHGFEPHPIEAQEAGALPALRFTVETALEDSTGLQEPGRKLSASFPEATVTVCEVEERFDQVEHLHSVVFIDGKQAGEIEHGYVLNIGA